jgi:hypothetical protein
VGIKKSETRFAFLYTTKGLKLRNAPPWTIRDETMSPEHHNESEDLGPARRFNMTITWKGHQGAAPVG